MTDATWILKEFVAHSSNITSVALSRHVDKLLASGGKDCKINLWRLDSANCQMTMSGHDSPVDSLAFHPSSPKLAGGNQKGTVKIWDLQNASLTHNFTKHKKSVKCIEFHAFGEFLATGSADNTVKLWDLRRKGCIMTYKEHNSPVSVLRYSPDGRWLASGDDTGIVKIWDLSCHKLLQAFNNHKEGITWLDFHPTELLMATSSNDSSVKIWDLDQMKLLENIEYNDTNKPRVVLFETTGKQLVCIGEKELQVYDWEPLNCHASINLKYNNTHHAIFSSNILIGADIVENRLATYAVDINKIPTRDKTIRNTMNKCRKTFIGQIPISAILASGDNKKSNFDTNDENEPNDVEVMDQDFINFLGKEREPARNISSDDASTIEEIKKGHRTFIEACNRKNYDLNKVKKEWISRGVKSAVSLAINLEDQSVVVDILHILLSDVRLWNLDICQLLLPVLYNLMQTNVEKNLHISLSTLRLIGHTFGPTIKSNVNSPPYPNENDIARQERFQKCKFCYKQLTQIFNFLSKKKTAVTRGRLAEKIQEMHELIGRTVI